MTPSPTASHGAHTWKVIAIVILVCVGIAGLGAFVYRAAPVDDRARFDVVNKMYEDYRRDFLKATIANYPIKSSFARSLVYPKNSIRQIPGVWDKLKWNVMASQMTLEDLEHKHLCLDFAEPRIHMALVCAAMGCPSLRNEPYAAEKLDDQLNDEARKFLSDVKKFHLDRKAKRVYLSPIFKWFGSDFVSKYPPGEKFADFDEDERAVLAFVSRYLFDGDGEFLEAGGYSLKYLDYDWTLNVSAWAVGGS